MTNEQINAAIAEVCGWTEISSCTCEFKLSGMPPYWAAHKKHIPDYCADLNAMHEAEKTIYKHHNLWSAYYYHVGAGAQGLHATARKKAEAFLRTLGKWEATDKDSLTVGSTTEESSADHFRDSTKKEGGAGMSKTILVLVSIVLCYFGYQWKVWWIRSITCQCQCQKEVQK